MVRSPLRVNLPGDCGGDRKRVAAEIQSVKSAQTAADSGSAACFPGELWEAIADYAVGGHVRPDRPDVGELYRYQSDGAR